MKTIAIFNCPEVTNGVKAVKIKYDSEWEEFKVMFVDVNGKRINDMTYFTDDKDDAFDTAQSMLDGMKEAL